MGISTVIQIIEKEENKESLAQSASALITVPSPNRLARQANTLPVEPLIGTLVIIASHHVPMTDSAAGTIDLGILITLILILIIDILISRTITLVGVRCISTAEHGVIILITFSIRRLL